MTAARSPRFAFGAAALGHGLALAGFLQPWVVGQFGAREQLSGLDLARLAGGVITHGLAGEILALAVSRFALLLVPLAAANALVLLGAIALGALNHGTAHRASVWLAVPIVLVSLVGLAVVLLSMGDGSVLRRPGIGLLVVILGASLVIASTALSTPVAAAED